MTEREMLGMGTMTRVRFSVLAKTLSRSMCSSAVDGVVLVVDEPHDGHEDGDDDRHQERLGRLADEHHDEDGRGHESPDGVDAQPPAPAAHAVVPPVPHHAALAEGEGQEDAHRVERDEGVHVAAERDQQQRGDPRQHDDACRVGQPVAAIGEVAGEVVILGQDGGQAREGREGRVGSQDEDERGEGLEEVEAHRSGPEDRAGDLRHDGDISAGDDGEVIGQVGDADEQGAQQHGHDRERGGRVARLGSA